MRGRDFAISWLQDRVARAIQDANRAECMDLLRKLEILADAAKYDASCASSGISKRDSLCEEHGVGSTEGMGICEVVTDGAGNFDFARDDSARLAHRLTPKPVQGELLAAA